METKGHLEVEALEALPLLPLPEYTLFPHTLVPFHVFEPRYLKMLDACLAGRRLLVVAGLKPGWEARHREEASTYRVAGLGRVVSERRARDGRTNIFVHCVERVELVQDVQVEPFRRVDVRPLMDVQRSDLIAKTDDRYQRLLSLATRLARELGSHGGALSRVLGSTDDPTVLTHRLAAMVVELPEERQQILEIRTPDLRCQLLLDHMTERLMELAPPGADGAGWIN